MVEREDRESSDNVGQEAGAFFEGEERILNDIAGGSGFQFKRGNGWAINAETGEATYDPKFFEERGYTSSQALFGAFHELKCHLVETADILSSPEGEKTYQRFKHRAAKRRRIHIWENCRTAVKGNLAIMQFAPSLAEDIETVYREKHWPEKDLTSKPRHLQFMYAVLRRAMVPDEEVVIDPKVTEALDKLKNVKGKDVIALSTDPGQDPLLAMRLSERYIEPVIEKLYQEDLQDKQNQQKQQGGQSSQNQGRSGEPFEEDYEDYERRHPEPMDEEETEKKIKETLNRQNPTARKDAGYEQEHGVSKKDLDDYFQEYWKIEPQIEPYRAIFRRIVEERKVILRRLVGSKEEGVMIDPGLVVQTYIDVKSGVANPKTMKDIEGVVLPENIPGKADIYFLKDQSESMEGDKAIAQRRGAIVEAEALREGVEMLDEEQLADPLKLDVSTAFIGFGVPERVREYKELSKGVSEKQRVAIFKGLLELGGIGTNDFDGLVFIEKQIKGKMDRDADFAEELKHGRRRVVVIVTTDGGSNYQGMTETQARAQTKKKVGVLRGMGVVVKAIALVPNAADTKNIKEVYGSHDTTICPSSDKYYESTKTILEKDVLRPLRIDGNIEEEV